VPEEMDGLPTATISSTSSAWMALHPNPMI
jgi:hypothetical protein